MNLTTEMCILSSIFNLLSANKDAFDALKDIAETAAITIGGIWTYQVFILKRGKHPRAKLKQQIMHWPLVSGKRAVRVTVTIHNIGEILLKLSEGFTWIQQMEPLNPELGQALKSGVDLVKKDETEIQWPSIAECSYCKKGQMEIEPGENDEIICDLRNFSHKTTSWPSVDFVGDDVRSLILKI